MNRYELRLHVSDRGVQYDEFGVYEFVYADSIEEAKNKVKLGLCPIEFDSLEVILCND